jgi:uncharacterized membrane protein
LAQKCALCRPYIPWPRAAVLVSGGCELLGAVGLLWRPTRRAAGVGLFALTLAVTPVHIYMLQWPELFDVPYWALLLRLPLQAALLALIAWTVANSSEAGRGDGPISTQCIPSLGSAQDSRGRVSPAARIDLIGDRTKA